MHGSAEGLNQKRSPKYPIFIPSRGRADRKLSLTANLLEADGVPFFLVVEPQEAEQYRSIFGEERILVLPFRDRGYVTPARNWINSYSRERGDDRHWQIDDNVKSIMRWDGRKRKEIAPGEALRFAEDFVDRYSNIAISSLRNGAYVWATNKPFELNQGVCSVMLINNLMQFSWRGYAEDADYSLQALTMGFCTIVFNAFYFNKPKRMTMKGGNTDTIYAREGMLTPAKDIQRRWPDLVRIERRYGELRFRLNHVWRRFRTPLHKINS